MIFFFIKKWVGYFSPFFKDLFILIFVHATELGLFLEGKNIFFLYFCKKKYIRKEIIPILNLEI